MSDSSSDVDRSVRGGNERVVWVKRDASASRSALPSYLRIALYSPGMVGLGHMRRNTLIASGLAASVAGPVILMIAESREASAFSLPEGVDCLTLPGLRKHEGEFQPRYLKISLPDLVAFRTRVIQTALESFDPDLFIVDHLPRGAFRELDKVLDALHRRGRAKCILGLRDILGDPIRVRKEWETSGYYDTIRDFYNAVWIYGDPRVYDPVRECRFPNEVANKVQYTGYLDQRLRLNFDSFSVGNPFPGLNFPPGRLALCMVGGGQDGFALAEAFTRAVLPPQTNGLIVAGPYMPEHMYRKLKEDVRADARLRVVRFLDEPTALLALADYVVSMGGYNSVCEILSFRKRALIVPRAKCAPEQWIRATRLRELGLLDLIHQDELNPLAISRWFSSQSNRTPSSFSLDFNGMKRLVGLFESLLAEPSSPSTRMKRFS